ncbi:MAG: type II toxin-antitoxin system RelE/ParE family toxin [Magnetococcales bacterium]|nr:type II toxin-antitoxin system RelE/ParE family toxin [Magnetococcales bacterium]MBF0322328.1 type II toxin-antitoxin system RelE/ParE family toxin [Magnetococcales bacterium]
MRKLDAQTQARIVQAIRHLGENPRPSRCLKLSRLRDTYRIREGDFRIIYQEGCVDGHTKPSGFGVSMA